MKQNERLLVYAVTGFLAVILVVAVVFGNDPARAAGKGDGGGIGLEDLIRGDGAAKAPQPGESPAPSGGEFAGAGAPTNSGLAKPETVTPAGPLVVKPQLAADLVAKELGPSRRERMVRWVRAKEGDSLESLVRRWCGARDPYLDEARSLNETLTVLRLGQEVMVPWVDDEQLLALREASKPRVLASELQAKAPVDSPAVPDFQVPATIANQPGAGVPEVGGPAVASETYVVKPGDSLWKIAEKRWGRGKADRMVQEIKRLNPGLSDALKVGQKFLLPAGGSTE